MSRKVINGSGIGVTEIDTTGYTYVECHGLYDIQLIPQDPKATPCTYFPSYYGGGLYVIGNKGVRFECRSGDPWTVVLYERKPATDQSTILVIKRQDGTNTLEGDDDIVFKNEGVDFSGVDISDVRLDFDSLSLLYQRASTTKTAHDQGRYLKLKSLLIN
jgi:hypothetical protein